MKKNYTLILSLLLIASLCFQANAQVFQGMSYEELVRPILQMQRAHNQAISSINELYAYVTDVLGHDIDDQLRREMNAEHKTLDAIAKQLSSNGYSARINECINDSYRRIQKSIADYNNRVAKNNEQVAKEEAARRQEAACKAGLDDWSGTGFALKSGYIVTNFHVVDRAKSILVYGVNGSMTTSYSAIVVATDRINDLAVIKISDSRFSGFGTIPYSIKNQMAEVGEDIWVLGYPLTKVLGNDIKLTNGIISSRSGYQGDVATYQISAPVQPGNSGGPMFDSNGNVVGIVNAGVPGAENVGYAIKTSYLKNLTDSYSLSAYLPASNSISSLALKEQVKRVKNFAFLLVCSTKTGSCSSVNASTPSSLPSSSSSASGEEMSISKRYLSLKVGYSETLYAYNYGSSVKWESDNEAVATVSSTGRVTAVGPGRTIIWAIGKSVITCEVTVHNSCRF